MLDFDKILLDLGFGKYQIYCIISCCFFQINGQMQFIFVPFLQNSIANEWKIPNNKLLYLSSAEYFAFLIGSLASGYAGDYFGRKKLCLISSFSMTIILVILANAGSYEFFVIMRFFCAFFHIFSFLNSYVLFFETIDANNRGKVSNLLEIPIGGILFVIYLWIFLIDINSGNWRMVIYCTAIHSFIYFITTWLILDESVRFNLMKKNYENAFKTINRIAKNNKNIENYLDQEKKNQLIGWTVNFLSSWNMRNSKKNCCEWLFFKKFKKITPILWLVFFTVTFESFQIIYTLPFTILHLNQKTSKSKEVFQLIYLFVPVLFCPLITMLIIDKRYFGRVNTLSFFLFILFLLFGFISLEIFNFLLLASIIKFFSQMCFSLKYVLVCDLYPTIIRTMGLGVCSAIGRIGTIAMPFVVISLLNVYIYMPYIVSSILCLITAILIHFLPESASIPLDQLFQNNEKEIEIIEPIIKKY